MAEPVALPIHCFYCHAPLTLTVERTEDDPRHEWTCHVCQKTSSGQLGKQFVSVRSGHSQAQVQEKLKTDPQYGALVRPGVLALLALLLTRPVIAQTALVSVASGGGPAQGGASGQNAVAISGDGRVVAFESAAVNLVAGDTNTLVDVFVSDRFTRTISRVNIATGGTQAVGGASGGSGIALSGDGQFVAFTSTATNLVAGDSNGIADVFVHDRATGITTRVSVASNGAQGIGVGATRRPSLSADGRFVAFDSEMTNLVPGDTNAKSDVFVHDRVTGQTTRVSVATGGAEATGDSLGSLRASLSADGRVVAFISDALNLVSGDTNNFLDAFVHDRATGVTTRVSVQSGGGQAGGGDSFNVAISADRRYAVFDSEASVVPGDNNGDRDIFVHDRNTGDTVRVSVATGGAEANGNFGSRSPAISGDGRFVVFDSDATDLISGDTNSVGDVFLHDRVAGRTTRMSVSSVNAQAGAFSGTTAVSADGRIVAFGSNAANLAGGDTNQQRDVFVRDTRMFLRQRISLSAGGAQLPQPATGRPSVSANGRLVAFTTDAATVVPGDTNGQSDIFVRDRIAATTVRVSVATGGVEGGGGSSNPAVSGDGRVVAFESLASGLAPGDTNRRPDIFVHDLISNATTRVSVDSQGGQARGSSRFAATSADGRIVAFASDAQNLEPGDTNEGWDVFVHDRTTLRTVRVSVASGGQQASGDPMASPPSVSGDGGLVAFASTAPDLVTGDTNNRSDIFIHDIITSTTTRVSLPGPGRIGGASYVAVRDPRLSRDGRYVAFAADRQSSWLFGVGSGRDVLIHDRATGTTRLVTGGGLADLPALDADGRHVSFDRAASSLFTVNARGAFVHDQQTASTNLASVGGEAPASGSSAATDLSADGRLVAFRSAARTLVPGDTNGREDMFVRVTTPVVRDVSVRSGPAAGGTTLAILGEGFATGTSVTIGGVAAASVTFVDATRLEVTTPVHAGGLVDIVVEVPGFDVERLAYAFTCQP